MSPTLMTDDASTSLALRPREAAKRLGISQRTLWTWTQSGDVPHIRMGRAVLYPIAELRQWLAQRAQQSGN